MSHQSAPDLEADLRAPPDSGPRLYEFPQLYAALRPPDGDTVAAARRLIARHHEGVVRKVMDPACGPGTYLAPFSDEGLFVAGNDLSPAMVRAARERFRGRPCEFVCGDMRAFRFVSRPIDVALELSGTSGHLLDRESVLRHLDSVASNLRSGGLYLMVVFARTPPGRVHGAPLLTFEDGPRAVAGGGEAWIRYEQVAAADADGVELLRRIVATRDVPGCPPLLVEEYPLRTWTAPELQAVAADAGALEFLGIHPCDPARTEPGAEDLERIALFRRP
jgi:SAM-dependent methyltransferase